MSGADLYDFKERGLIGRARGLLIQPRAEWDRIASEVPGNVIGGYVVPLAAIGAMIGVLAAALYGGFEFDAALAQRVVSAVLYIAACIVGVMIADTLLAFLVKRFGGELEPGRGMQIAGYAATPILVAAIGALVPPLSALLVVAGVVYALAHVTFGIGRLANLPEAQDNLPRTVLSFTVAGAAIAALVLAFLGPLIASGREAVTGVVEEAAPPASAIATTERRPAAELAVERLAQSDGAHVLTDPARLEEQFPDTLPSGFERRSVATAHGGGVSRADAQYARNGASVHLAIIQFANTVDAAAAAALFDLDPDGATATGYARSQTIDGRYFAEEVDGENARYIVIGRGVAMIAEGQMTMDQGRAAVETIDLQRLEAMLGR